ncbi:MAG: ASCH domain-containing protein [Bacteroidota bacterium]
MQFTKRLHEPIRAGVVTCSIRIWKRLRVKAGEAYRLGQGPGYIVVDSIDEIEFQNVSHALAIESGFESVDDLMATARHGSGQDIYLIRFHYVDGDINQ